MKDLQDTSLNRSVQKQDTCVQEDLTGLSTDLRALREVPVDPAQLEAARQNVLAEIQGKAARRVGAGRTAVTGLLLAAGLAVMAAIPLMAEREGAAEAGMRVAIQQPVPKATDPAIEAAQSRPLFAKPEYIRIETGNPNIVILMVCGNEEKELSHETHV